MKQKKKEKERKKNFHFAGLKRESKKASEEE